MFIQKITICNLFAYYGKVEVEFKKIEGKNLYCIYGNNGFGKTSFIRCAKLLFLGVGVKEGEIPSVIKRFAPNIVSVKKLMKGDSSSWAGIFNKNAIREIQKDFFVSFEGTYSGQTFVLTRSFKNVYEDIDEKLEFKIDKEVLNDEEAQERINAILPPNLTDFFFFDGEELGELSNNLRKEFQEKIEEILQIKPLDSLIRQIKKNKDELRDNESVNNEQKFVLEQKRRKKENNEQELEHKKWQLRDIESFIEEKHTCMIQMQKKIDKISADSSQEKAELINEKNELDKEFSHSKERLRESIKSVIFVSNETILQDLKKEMQKLESNKSTNDIEALKKLLPEIKEFMSEEFRTNDFLKNIEFKDIENIIDKLPSKLGDRGISHSFLSQNMLVLLRESLARVESVNLNQDISEIKSIKNKLKQNTSFLNELNSDDATKEKLKELKEEMKNIEEEKKQKEREREKCKEHMRVLELEKRDIEKEIYSLEQNINTERIDNKLKILESLQKSVEQYREKLKNKLRSELRSLILQNYQKLLPNDNIKALDISEDFEIKLKDENDELIIVENQSSGQKQILAIAIFWALSKLSDSQLPLIIDTPLSRIDSDNRARIIQNYYARDTQVIILPHSGEMTRREYEYSKPHLAELYKIDNQDDRKHANIKIARIEEIL